MSNNWLTKLDILLQAGGNTVEHLQERYGPKAEKVARAQSTALHWAGVGGKAYGFYIPYRRAGQVRPFAETDTIVWLKERMDAEQATYRKHLQCISNYCERLADFAVRDPETPDSPRFDQSQCPGLDGASAYAFVRHHKPRNIVEVGSGHSTRFLVQAVRDEGLKTIFTSIDPDPQQPVDHLCDLMLRTDVANVPLTEFDRLDCGDILFCDTSHVVMPGTDADHLLSRVLPGLRKGVRICLRGMLLPHGYPQAWADGSFNEQAAVAAMLSGGGRYRLLLPAAYCARHMPEDVQPLNLPRTEGAHQTALWLEVAE